MAKGAPQQTSDLAIVAFVLSLLVVIPLVPLVGAFLGIIAVVHIRDRPWLRGRRLAIAAIPSGIALGALFFAIAIPALDQSFRRSKGVEPTESLDQVRNGAKRYTLAHPGSFPVGDTGWTPRTVCCEDSRHKCKPNAAAWNSTIWRQLGFSMDEAHDFQYRYVGTKKSFVIEARGDLDCDGIYSNYRLETSFDAKGAMRSHGPIITDELE